MLTTIQLYYKVKKSRWRLRSSWHQHPLTRLRDVNSIDLSEGPSSRKKQCLEYSEIKKKNVLTAHNFSLLDINRIDFSEGSIPPPYVENLTHQTSSEQQKRAHLSSRNTKTRAQGDFKVLHWIRVVDLTKTRTKKTRIRERELCQFFVKWNICWHWTETSTEPV